MSVFRKYSSSVRERDGREMIRESVGSHTAKTRYRTHSGQRGMLIERLVGLRGYQSFEEICQLGDGLLAIQLDARSGWEERFDLDA